jgi:DNA-binding NtrC family response regulator
MSVLLVLPMDRCRSLVPKLQRPTKQIFTADNCRSAQKLLAENLDIELVITGVSLDDGNWCDVVRYIVDRGHHAEIIVSSPVASQTLWSEVIWRGAYDLLLEPYDLEEVERLVDGALRAARETSFRLDRRYQANAA